ncbi:RNA polymerase sigma-70 factor, ECF subfamily [Chitinophaga jiangningensis]|uniref:RNA polymerase sigma-70 factor, ECF subfamily n=1 Tax=Chitinophaga jiangningensis TaxID=1419482 RepID=A0A1M7MVW7_9BACT|nr:sigma-70 family RNA polymerase sigma factor [Chitinophaga jiangningensis]SHM95310.1 RNA polymerase sigma-70 factor, ECF subfamily [Chitinophaga jiangningensis]
MGRDELLNANDQDLLAEISRRNGLAFDVLYNRYWKEVFNIAYKRVHNMDMAQDIAQDVFVQLWSREKDTPIENLPGYLRIATRNGVFRQMEKESRYGDLPEDSDDLRSYGLADGHVLYKEFYAAFEALTNTLPAQQKQIFNLRFQEGRSSQEIAEQLNISVKTVRNQMGRALSTLRESLIVLQIAIMLTMK